AGRRADAADRRRGVRAAGGGVCAHRPRAQAHDAQRRRGAGGGDDRLGPAHERLGADELGVSAQAARLARSETTVPAASTTSTLARLASGPNSSASAASSLTPTSSSSTAMV